MESETKRMGNGTKRVRNGILLVENGILDPTLSDPLIFISTKISK